MVCDRISITDHRWENIMYWNKEYWLEWIFAASYIVP